MSKRRWRHRQKDSAEINITAFMNLMVILVPFLLITAVFSRLAVLELNLPTSQSEPNEEPPQAMMLEVTVREGLIEVGDRNAGVLTRIQNGPEGYELQQLSDFLKRVKRQFPTKTDATLLLEPDISYDVVVQVMDAMRLVEQRQDDRFVKAELFPEIAIGDAPALN